MRIITIATIVAAIALPVLAADEAPEMATVEGEHIILKVVADDLKHLNDPEAWVAKLDKIYEAYVDLVGSAPYGGEKITILSVEDNPGGWAVAGNPIKWYRKYIVPTFEKNINKGDWCFGICHEISHDFDLDFDARWAWELEFWANFKMDYAFPAAKAVILYEGGVSDYGDPNGRRMTDLYREHEIERGYGDLMLKGGWFDDGIHDKFTQIIAKTGWEPMKGLFRWFNSLGPDEYTHDRLCKRSLFIRVLEEQSGMNLSDQFIDWGFNYLSVDPKYARDAKQVSRIFCEKKWNADIVQRPICVSPGEEVTVRVDVIEQNPKDFKKGLGTHSNSEIVYNLDGKYKTFESYVGMPGREAAEGGWGSVIFEVVADGESLYKSPLMRGGRMYKHASVDVTGVKGLKLIVNDAGDGIYGDGCGWLDAKLIGSDGAVTYLSDLKEVSAKQGFSYLHKDEDIDGNPLMFLYGPCKGKARIVGEVGGKKVEFKQSSEPEVYECTLDGFDKGMHVVKLTVNVGDSPITQHDPVVVIVE